MLAQTGGENTSRFVHGPHGILGHQNPSDEWGWAAQDGLGSVRVEADDDLAVSASQNLTPPGVPFGLQGEFGLPFGFTGEMVDENELVYLRTRYYSPALGVFTGLDPVENGNRYQYVSGNPTNWTDPNGLCPITDPDCIKKHFGEAVAVVWQSTTAGAQVLTTVGAQYLFGIAEYGIPSSDPALELCARGLTVKECETIKRYGEQWLQTAREINVPDITGMNDEAFAAMLGGKVIFEDVGGWGARLSGMGAASPMFASVWEFVNPTLCSTFGICALPGVPYGEISYGPANIPGSQAVNAAAWWQTTASSLVLQPQIRW